MTRASTPPAYERCPGCLVLLGIDDGRLNPPARPDRPCSPTTDPGALGQVWAFVFVRVVASAMAVFVWLMIDDADLDDTPFDETFLDDAQNALGGDPD